MAHKASSLVSLKVESYLMTTVAMALQDAANNARTNGLYHTAATQYRLSAQAWKLCTTDCADQVANALLQTADDCIRADRPIA